MIVTGASAAPMTWSPRGPGVINSASDTSPPAAGCATAVSGRFQRQQPAPPATTTPAAAAPPSSTLRRVMAGLAATFSWVMACYTRAIEWIFRPARYPETADVAMACGLAKAFLWSRLFDGCPQPGKRVAQVLVGNAGEI